MLIKEKGIALTLNRQDKICPFVLQSLPVSLLYDLISGFHCSKAILQIES